MAFRVYTPLTAIQDSTVYKWGNILSTNVLSPSNGDIMSFNGSLWEAIEQKMSMGNEISPPNVSLSYNINGREEKHSPNVSLSYNIIGKNNVSPSSQIENNVLPALNTSLTREDFVSVLGREETDSLFEILASVLITEKIISIAGCQNTSGTNNVYIGGGNCKGSKNTFVGDAAGGETLNASDASDASYNTFVGCEAGFSNKTGNGNVAVGVVAGASLDAGCWNTLVGQSAGNFVKNANANVAVGSNAGLSLVNGENNVVIGDGADVSSENAKNQIVIGKGVMGYGDNTITFPKNLTPYPSGTEVNFSSTGGGCLYPVSSSLRWKEDIADIKEKIDTSKLYDLRPVTYKTKIGHGDTTATHIGLVAEEVDKLFPHLVPKDDEGHPASVRYSLLPVIVIEELKKLREEVERLKK